MVRMFVRHSVDDYAVWRRAYDAFDQERRSMGVTDDAVFQSVGDSNEVTVWHDFETPQAAESFATSDRLKSVMQDAGVRGQPAIWIATQA